MPRNKNRDQIQYLGKKQNYKDGVYVGDTKTIV